MSLCDLCKTIPLWNLPPALKESTYSISLTEKSHYFKLHLKDDALRNPESWGFHWHQDRGGLWQSAAGGCSICRVVDKQARLLLGDLSTGVSRPEEVERWPQETLLRRAKDANDCSDSGNEEEDYLPRPSFDLWLTSRGSCGAGMTVLSTSISEQGAATARCLIPIAIVGFCAELGDPLATMVRGVTVESIPGAAAFKTAASWLEKCERQHRCREQDQVASPAILLDLGDGKENPELSTIKISRTPKEVIRRYVALSYLRDTISTGGGGSSVGADTNLEAEGGKTSPQSLNAIGREIFLDKLPQLFKDAILATQRLGLRYLWIDHLCNPSSDVEKVWTPLDATDHAQAYRGAYLTISATGASGTLQGLFEQRKPRGYARFQTTVSNTTTGKKITGNLAAVGLSPQDEMMARRHVELRSEPLSRSAWALQERVLARRVLHFASDQLYFECSGGEFGLVSEEGTYSKPPRFHYIPPELPESESITRWYKLLMHYSGLSIANPGDRLCAIAAIAHMFRENAGLPDRENEYLAGIWRSRGVEGLLWERVQEDTEAARGWSPRDRNTPSWSWASVSGSIVCHGPAIGGEYHDMGDIKDAQVNLANPSQPFGGVTGGSIKLRAPILTLELGGSAVHTEKATFTGTKHQQAGDRCSVHFDTDSDHVAHEAGQMKLFAVVLMMKPCRGNGKRYLGLVTTPTTTSGDENATMRRVGFFNQTSAQLRKHYGIEPDAAMVQTVLTLV